MGLQGVLLLCSLSPSLESTESFTLESVSLAISAQSSPESKLPGCQTEGGCWNSLLAAVIQGGRHVLASFPGFPSAPSLARHRQAFFSPLPSAPLALRQRLLSSIQVLSLTSHSQNPGHTWHFLPNEILVQRVSCFCL